MMQQRKVQCWIFSRGNQGQEQCLLLKTNKARGEFWQPITGTVEDHEGFFEAACRESVEETGFTFDTKPLDTTYEFEFASRSGHAKERVFALYISDCPTPKIDPKEHQDFQWIVPAKSIAHLRYPSNTNGLKHAYQLFFGNPLLEEEP
ncbi:MAG: NUDIX domain-containing protein [Bdellovibrionota bacterium]